MNKEIKSTVQGIFPVPIYFSDLKNPLNKKQITFIKNNKTRTNEGNFSSQDNYILNNKNLSSLKKELETKINDYFNKIIKPLDDIKPYITQSWLNFTNRNEYHHQHAHANSIVSGVLYLDVDPKKDKIFFHNNVYKQIDIYSQEYNPFNSNSWWFPIQNNQLILFPSSTTHSVEIKKENNKRISLAFNTFVKGKIGHNDNLTELILK
mgnify:CR=1|tara:strand:- start:2070 stop:2690 length:621 start_codon:yes stop_codon:yes gene_type:complete